MRFVLVCDSTSCSLYSKLQCLLALSALHKGDYNSAAQHFLSVTPRLQSNFAGAPRIAAVCRVHVSSHSRAHRKCAAPGVLSATPKCRVHVRTGDITMSVVQRSLPRMTSRCSAVYVRWRRFRERTSSPR